jgi:hypothetical protein
MNLPVCSHRGSASEEGRYPCASPKLVVPRNGVPAATCQRCPYADASQPPSLLTKAASLAAAVVKHAAGGFQQTTPAEFDARLAVCAGCPEFTGNSCRKCGCGLRAKASMRTESCPLAKWPKLTS